MNVSIITVCKNAESTISRTIDSVLDQTYHNFEYIILDGKSTDRTFDIVKSYAEKFKMKGIRYLFFSKPDNGIFDAMNKAARLANGTWINFMNADDCFHNKYVLRDIFTHHNYDSYSVIYGNTLRMSEKGSQIGYSSSIENIRLNMPFCHQSSFTRTELLKAKQFNLNYRVADYYFFLSIFLDGYKFLQVPLIIANYSMMGFSNSNRYKTYLGTVKVRKDLGVLKRSRLKQNLVNFYFKQLLLNEAPFHDFVTKIDNKVSRRSNRP